MNKVSQLTFKLGNPVALDRDDFIPSNSNITALKWIDAWPNWPKGISGLNVFGPKASGKTHLAEVWKSRSKALIVDSSISDPLLVRELLGAYKNVVVDNFDSFWNGEPILHLFNLVVAKRGFVLFLSERPLTQLGITPPDLASRVTTLPTVEIKSPDDDLIKGVMAKLFKDRQILVANEVIDFLFLRMERSFQEVEKLVDKLDTESLAQNNAVTLPLAKRIIEELY